MRAKYVDSLSFFLSFFLSRVSIEPQSRSVVVVVGSFSKEGR